MRMLKIIKITTLSDTSVTINIDVYKNSNTTQCSFSLKRITFHSIAILFPKLCSKSSRGETVTEGIIY